MSMRRWKAAWLRVVWVVAVATSLARSSSPGAREAGRPPDTSTAPCQARVVQLAAGKSHACALLDDGTVRCWGSNYSGQLGDGTTTFRTAPVAVSGLRNVAFIAAGDRHTCAALLEGSVSCWGANDHGQVGRAIADKGAIAASGFSADHSARPETVAGVANIKALAAGETHAVALAKDGSVYFWGAADDLTERRVDVKKPFRVSIPPATSVAAGFRRSCAATLKGAYCWGASLAAVGRRTGPNHLAPFRAPELDAFPSFALGLGSTCGLSRDGAVSCLGEDAVKGESGAVSVATSWHTCEVLATGQVSCWGRGNLGQLGDGAASSSETPVRVPDVRDASQVVVGESSTCIRTRDGRALCWGENGYGQLGDATTEQRALPTEVRFCAVQPEPVFQSPPEGAPLLAALQRTSCFGTCPVYSVRVFDDGTVIYRGDWSVRMRGTRKTKLSGASLAELRKKFRAARFLELPYQCGEASTDAPSASLFFRDGTRVRLLDHYHGCKGAPAILATLEDELDRLTGTDQWTGSAGFNAPTDLQAHEPPFRLDGNELRSAWK
jgi:hypothetical protein